MSPPHWKVGFVVSSFKTSYSQVRCKVCVLVRVFLSKQPYSVPWSSSSQVKKILLHQSPKLFAPDVISQVRRYINCHAMQQLTLFFMHYLRVYNRRLDVLSRRVSVLAKPVHVCVHSLRRHSRLPELQGRRHGFLRYYYYYYSLRIINQHSSIVM